MDEYHGKGEMAKVTESKLTEFTPDEKNANKGTERGRYMLETSIEKVGAGRSIVVDKHGKVIAGNKTQEVAIAKGIEDAIVVETDGTQLVVTKRTDLDLDDPDPNNPARQYAYLDNRTGEIGLEWDAGQIQLDLEAGLDLSEMFRDWELAALGALELDPQDPNELWEGMPEFEQEDLAPYQTIKVHFASEGDREAFAELVGQKITGKTPSIWYPAAVPLPQGRVITLDGS